MWLFWACRKLLDLNRERFARILFREVQIYEKNLNFCYRPVRITVLEAALNLAPIIGGFSLIAFHDRLNFFATIIIALIAIVGIVVLLVVCKYLELYEGSTEDFSKSLLARAGNKKKLDKMRELIQFEKSLLPIRMYKRLTYFKRGFTLTTLDTVSNNIINLLLLK